MTLDELKKKVQDVQNLAVAESKARIDEVKQDRMTQVIAVGVGAVVLLGCAAYLIGSGSGRRKAKRDFERILKDPCGPLGPFGKDVEL